MAAGTGGVGASAWEYVPTGFPVSAVSSIAFAPGNSNTNYIGTGEVYNYPNTVILARVISQQSSDVVYAASAPLVVRRPGVFRTTDGGRTWQEFSEGLPDAVIVFDLSLSPMNPKLRVATHGNEVYERGLMGGSN